MKLRSLKYILVSIILLNIANAKGQVPMSMYYLKNTPQSILLNPAKEPRPNFFIGIPLLNGGLSINSDMPLTDLIQVNSAGNAFIPSDSEYDYDKLYDLIGDGVNLSGQQHITPLMFGFRFKKGYFTFSISEKLSMNYGMPKGFFTLLQENLPDNANISLNGLNFQNAAYHEFAFSYSRNINEKLSVAARFKKLYGIAATKTEFSNFNIQSSGSLYEIVADADILTSVPGMTIEYDENGLPTDTEDDDSGSYFSFKNPGFGIDLGAVYDFNERWSFSAALNDIGAIKWNDNLNTISAHGSYDYDDAVGDFSGMEDGNSEAILDSLLSGIGVEHDPMSFKTKLNTSLYLGAEYNVNHVFSLGFLSRSVFQKDFFRQDFNVSANLNLYHRLATSVNYNLSLQGGSNIGLGVSSFIGPLQLFVMMDNIALSSEKYNIDGDEITTFGDMQNASFMFGVNLVFGAKGFKDKTMLNLKNR